MSSRIHDYTIRDAIRLSMPAGTRFDSHLRLFLTQNVLTQNALYFYQQLTSAHLSLKVQDLGVGRELLFEDVTDRREVFWLSNIYLENCFPTPLPSSASVKPFGLSDQCVQIVDDLQNLFIRFTEVDTSMSHHARRPGDEEMRAAYGRSQDGSRKGRTARAIGRRILVCGHLPWVLNMNSRMFCREEMEIEWSRLRPDRSRRREGSREI
jgi:hypothetical protein